MLADPSLPATQFGAAPRTRRAVPAFLVTGAPAGLAFTAAAGLVIAYALPDGAYGVSTRQSYAIVVWAVLGLGCLCGVLPRARPSRQLLAALGLLVLYAGWTALSLTWTESSERTTAELARILGYVGIVALLSLVIDARTWRSALLGAATGALLVCLLALLSRVAPNAFPRNPLYGSNRLTYPFGYWNAVGAWAAMAATMGLAWSAHDAVRGRRAAVLALVPVATTTLYLSYSRAAVVGVVVGAVLVIALSRHRLTASAHALLVAAATALTVLAVRHEHAIASGTGTRGAGAVLGAVTAGGLVVALGAWLTQTVGLDRLRLPGWLRSALVLGAAAAVAFSAAAFGPRLVSHGWRQFRRPVVATSADPAARLTQLSGNRYVLWRAALSEFDAHPFSGSGAGTFEFWWNRRGSDSEFVRNAHSLELENLAELGLPGLLLLLAALVAAVAAVGAAWKGARRRLSRGAAAGALAALVVYLLQASVDWLWQSTAVTVLALVLVSAGAARRSRTRAEGRVLPRALLAVAAVAAITLEIPGLLAAAAVARSQAAERDGNPAQALAWAGAAVGAEPWSASAYEQRALVYEAGGRLAPATGDLRHAISLEPTNYRHWLLLARVDAEAGRLSAAERDYERARELRPRALLFNVGAPGP